MGGVGYSHVLRPESAVTRDELSAIQNSRQTTVEFGDVYIYGGNEDTVAKHREVNRQFVNDVLKQLNVKK